MAITNHERVGKTLDLLKSGLGSYVEREFKNQFRDHALQEAQRFVTSERLDAKRGFESWDAAVLLAAMWGAWNDVFRQTLGQAERTLVSELRGVRNRWAHQEAFTTDDAYRALDSAERLLTAVSAAQAGDVGRMKLELLRVKFEEQLRTEKRKTATTAVESAAASSLKPWREVVSPHKDVASGRYQLAEFAADLWQVHIGEGSDEYRNPAEFFRRTFLTESLKDLLSGAVRRLTGDKGDPVVQLQTNFGGGKTHSMLALYHLFSGVKPGDLLGVDTVLKEAGVSKVPAVNRVVLVGNKISPGNPVTKSDGTIVRTLWGELAWQLGFAAGGAKEAKKAFSRIAADDEKGTSPGDVLRDLMNQYGPCLILVDEWVAYARQLHDEGDLPAGSFETHFSFAQVLTESAKLAKRCLLVISLPASDATGSPHAVADDVEVGGQRGRAALDRLRNAVGRVEASWRPATAEEGFEIVRRRLFEPPVEREQFVARDTVARAFFDLYRKEHQEFPKECSESDYEARMKAAYPIHPEVFDRLYTDWSTLLKFQRTRGVLRLMAAVIHSLWENGDKNPLILPGNIPIDDPNVQKELTRYLPDNWVPVIERDVDGPSALPLKVDREVGNLGKYAATRRVARTIYLGSAPMGGAANKGLEDRRIRLGCVMPGEAPAIFGDALRRLAASATFLYQDGPRYWYSTQPTVTKLAEDRAEQLKRDPDKVHAELEKRLRADLKKPGDFRGVHPLPMSGQDVPDDVDVRLVVLGPDHPYSKDSGNAAEKQAKGILEFRGNAPRLFRNTLVFLAPDLARYQDLDEAIRRFLAWDEIVGDHEKLDLSPHQVKQAETQKAGADSVVASRLPETYQWLLVPVQPKPDAAVEMQALRLQGGADGLAVRASKKLRGDELLITSFAGTRLRMELDRVPLWRGNHVTVPQLFEDFAKYLYLPRVADSGVLAGAVVDGLKLLTWRQDSFAYADSYDEGAERYRGLRGGELVSVSATSTSGLLVRADVAQKQLEADVSVPPPRPVAPGGGDRVDTPGGDTGDGPGEAPDKPVMRRFSGSVKLDVTRVGRDAGRVAEEVIAHLSSLVGAEVTVTLEIEAAVPSGVPDDKVRIVNENARTLKFQHQAFERD